MMLLAQMRLLLAQMRHPTQHLASIMPSDLPYRGLERGPLPPAQRQITHVFQCLSRGPGRLYCKLSCKPRRIQSQININDPNDLGKKYRRHSSGGSWSWEASAWDQDHHGCNTPAPVTITYAQLCVRCGTMPQLKVECVGPSLTVLGRGSRRQCSRVRVQGPGMVECGTSQQKITAISLARTQHLSRDLDDPPRPQIETRCRRHPVTALQHPTTKDHEPRSTICEPDLYRSTNKLP
jgi:hypothetical protein